MSITLRPATPADAEACSRVCFEAFGAIAKQHNFPPDLPTIEIANGMANALLSMPGMYSVIAEMDGEVVGSNFMWECDTIGGIGPVSVAPHVQNSAIGRQLMNDVLRRAQEKKLVGVRLVQAAFHNRSLALYTKLGFDVREPLAQMRGEGLKIKIAGYEVRKATQSDLEACNRVCLQVHGHNRGNELMGAIAQGTALVVERNGAITGYTTGLYFFGHSVAKTNEDLKALIGAADTYRDSGFLVPTRNSELFRWCLEHGLRINQQMNLMSIGLYNQPSGAFLPSVTF